jgi:hypothetical protein
MYNHFIFTSILNPSEPSYDKCHKLSFLMSKTVFVLYWSFGGKNHRFFFTKSVKLLPVNSSRLNH